MKKLLEVRFPHQQKGFVPALVELAEKQALKRVDIAKAVALKLGTNWKTEAVLFGFFIRGERAIPKSRITALAEVFKVTEDEILKINDLFHLHPESLVVRFEPDLVFDPNLIPDDCKTIGAFLIWLHLETERKRLFGAL